MAVLLDSLNTFMYSTIDLDYFYYSCITRNWSFRWGDDFHLHHRSQQSIVEFQYFVTKSC